MKPIAIGTWKFAKAGVQEAMGLLTRGADAIDAVEKAVRIIEDDPSVASVGFGGAPNSEGVVELDAAIMYGPGHRYGAVAGLQDIREAISVARLVMETTPHCLIVGEGARKFAIGHGFKPCQLLVERELEKWNEWKRSGKTESSHDTVCILALDSKCNLCVGTSTSGVRYKLPGRVGDTPLVGNGLYCDNDVGAAAATGVGEHIMRYCMSHHIVEEMQRGADPASACRSAITKALDHERHLREVMFAVLALDRHGQWGAAASREGFCVAVGQAGGLVELVDIPPV